MECNEQQSMVSATKTLYENFLEEKCETDFLIPDYYPAAEKIIHCSAYPVVSSKEIVGDRLNLEGTCRFTVIYQGEEESGIKSLTETVRFEESLPVKDAGKDPWVQVAVRMSSTSCRLLNPRKINCRAIASVAIKVKEQQNMKIIDAMDCEGMETLFAPVSIYTVLEHPYDSIKVQGEIEVHTPIQDVLKIDGFVSVKDVKISAGKALMKGVLNLFLLFTPEADPQKVEATSTAIPFTHILETRTQSEECSMEVQSCIRSVRADVETDGDGKNRMIAITATLQTEGEVFQNIRQDLLMDAYSNTYPLELEKSQLVLEELAERCELNETLRHTLAIDVESAEILQMTATPMIQKISGQGNTLAIDGVLDITMMLAEGNHYHAIDKSLPFTLNKELRQLDGRMRCEIHPEVISSSWVMNGEKAELKTELNCSLLILARNNYEVISDVRLDDEHPCAKGERSPLVVYYGDKGERLWDIARRYSTSVATIKSVNGLDQDQLEDKKLLLISRA